mgnify:CR=1 FL=1
MGGGGGENVENFSVFLASNTQGLKTKQKKKSMPVASAAPHPIVVSKHKKNVLQKTPQLSPLLLQAQQQQWLR